MDETENKIFSYYNFVKFVTKFSGPIIDMYWKKINSWCAQANMMCQKLYFFYFLNF